jgi:hypothetical protein
MEQDAILLLTCSRLSRPEDCPLLDDVDLRRRKHWVGGGPEGGVQAAINCVTNTQEGQDDERGKS